MNGVVFALSGGVISHEKHVCSKCSYIAKSEASLAGHTLSVHTSVAREVHVCSGVCSTCGYTAKSEASLAGHKLRAHTPVHDKSNKTGHKDRQRKGSSFDLKSKLRAMIKNVEKKPKKRRKKESINYCDVDFDVTRGRLIDEGIFSDERTQDNDILDSHYQMDGNECDDFCGNKMEDGRHISATDVNEADHSTNGGDIADDHNMDSDGGQSEEDIFTETDKTTEDKRLIKRFLLRNHFLNGNSILWVDGIRYVANNSEIQVTIDNKKYTFEIDIASRRVIVDGIQCYVFGSPPSHCQLGESIHEVFFSFADREIRYKGKPYLLSHNKTEARPILIKNSKRCYRVSYIPVDPRTRKTATVFVDTENYEVPLDGPGIVIQVQGNFHTIQIGGPGHQLIVDGWPNEVIFNGSPELIYFGNSPFLVQLMTCDAVKTSWVPTAVPTSNESALENEIESDDVDDDDFTESIGKAIKTVASEVDGNNNQPLDQTLEQVNSREYREFTRLI